MSGGVLPAIGAGCALAGLILWRAPRTAWWRAAACAAGGLALAGVWKLSGLESSETAAASGLRAFMWGGESYLAQWIGILWGVVWMIGGFGCSLAAALLWLGEAGEARRAGLRRDAGVLLCAAIGAFGWAMTALYVLVHYDAPEPVVWTLTALDMAGLLGALSLREKKA